MGSGVSHPRDSVSYPGRPPHRRAASSRGTGIGRTFIIVARFRLRLFDRPRRSVEALVLGAPGPGRPGRRSLDPSFSAPVPRGGERSRDRAVAGLAPSSRRAGCRTAVPRTAARPPGDGPTATIRRVVAPTSRPHRRSGTGPVVRTARRVLAGVQTARPVHAGRRTPVDPAGPAGTSAGTSDPVETGRIPVVHPVAVPSARTRTVSRPRPAGAPGRTPRTVPVAVDDPRLAAASARAPFPATGDGPPGAAGVGADPRYVVRESALPSPVFRLAAAVVVLLPADVVLLPADVVLLPADVVFRLVAAVVAVALPFAADPAGAVPGDGGRTVESAGTGDDLHRRPPARVGTRAGGVRRRSGLDSPCVPVTPAPNRSRSVTS